MTGPMSDKHLMQIALDLAGDSVSRLAKEAGINPATVRLIRSGEQETLHNRTREKVMAYVMRNQALPRFSDRVEWENARLTDAFNAAKGTPVPEEMNPEEADRQKLRDLIEDRWLFFAMIDWEQCPDPAGWRFLRSRYLVIAAWVKVPIPGLTVPESIENALYDLARCEEYIRMSSTEAENLSWFLGRVLSLKASALQLRAGLQGKGQLPLGQALSLDEIRSLAAYLDRNVTCYARVKFDPRLRTDAINAVAAYSVLGSLTTDRKERAHADKRMLFAHRELVKKHRWPGFSDPTNRPWSSGSDSVPDDPDFERFRAIIAQRREK